MKKVVALALVACFLSACPTLHPGEAYVKADRDTFEAVNPVLRALITPTPDDDPDLSGVNGRALELVLDSWDKRIATAEKIIEEGGVTPSASGTGGGE